MKAKITAVLIVSALLFSGCDQIRGLLGMPTSSDIAAKKLKIAAKMQKEKDSSALQIGDTVAATAMKPAVNPMGKKMTEVPMPARTSENEGLKYRYYIIVGSYREAANVQRRMADVRGNGGVPVLIEKDELTLVGAAGFNSMSAAADAMGDVSNFASDAWIYVRK